MLTSAIIQDVELPS